MPWRAYSPDFYFSAMIVWRLENKDGKGPYRGGFSQQRAMRQEHADDYQNHRSPWDDAVLGEFFYRRDQKNKFFGFDSLGMLTEWFGKYLPALEREGWSIVRYEAPKDTFVVSPYNGQVCFVKHLAKKLES